MQLDAWLSGPPTDAAIFEGKTFKGYLRKDGQVGTRNNWLASLVFCENNNLMTLREVFNRELGFTNHSGYQNELRNLTEMYKNGASVDEILNASENVSSKPASSNNLSNVNGLKFLFHSMGCVEQRRLTGSCQTPCRVHQASKHCRRNYS